MEWKSDPQKFQNARLLPVKCIMLYPANQKARCLYCHLHNAKNYTQRKCPDCNLVPALCQTVERDCHSAWHSETFAVVRKLWYEHRSHATSLHVASSSTSGCSSTRGHRGMSESRSSQEVSSTSQEACSPKGEYQSLEESRELSKPKIIASEYSYELFFILSNLNSFQ